MSKIFDSSRKIADIISVIDRIAFQTNILALNAAVEAANEIKLLIDESVSTVEGGAQLVTNAGTTMTEVVDQVKRASDLIAEITLTEAVNVFANSRGLAFPKI